MTDLNDVIREKFRTYSAELARIIETNEYSNNRWQEAFTAWTNYRNGFKDGVDITHGS